MEFNHKNDLKEAVMNAALEHFDGGSESSNYLIAEITLPGFLNAQVQILVTQEVSDFITNTEPKVPTYGISNDF